MQRSQGLLQYTRDKKRRKIGCMVAFAENGKIWIGWSKCRLTGIKDKRDNFNRERGVEIAFERAFKYFDYLSLKGMRKDKKPIFPHSMQADFEKFIAKVIYYYTKNGNKFDFPRFTN